MAEESNSLWLLKVIKQVSAGVDSGANEVYTYHEKVIELAWLQQGPVETIDKYRTRFTSTNIGNDRRKRNIPSV